MVKDKLTAYTISRETMRWMEKWNPANEGLYTATNNGKSDAKMDFTLKTKKVVYTGNKIVLKR